MQKLLSWIDPFAYIQRFTLPKLLWLGTNDPYWTVDSLRHYRNDLPEPKLIYQTPNADHDLNGGDQALQTIAAFFEFIAGQKPLPKIAWKFNNVAKSRINAQVYSNEQAGNISLWTAQSDDRNIQGNLWTAKTMNITRGRNHANALIPLPKSGFQACLNVGWTENWYRPSLQTISPSSSVARDYAL